MKKSSLSAIYKIATEQVAYKYSVALGSSEPRVTTKGQLSVKSKGATNRQSQKKEVSPKPSRG